MRGRRAVRPADERLRVDPDRRLGEDHRPGAGRQELAGAEQGEEARHDRLLQLERGVVGEQVGRAQGEVAVAEVVGVDVVPAVAEDQVALAGGHHPVARVERRGELRGDEPGDAGRRQRLEPDARPVGRRVVGDHPAGLHEQLTGEADAVGVVVARDVVVVRERRRVEGLHQIFCSEAWT
jgi:hypothetical protein